MWGWHTIYPLECFFKGEKEIDRCTVWLETSALIPLPDIWGDKKSIRGWWLFFFNVATIFRKSFLTKNVFSVLSVDWKKPRKHFFLLTSLLRFPQVVWLLRVNDPFASILGCQVLLTPKRVLIDIQRGGLRENITQVHKAGQDYSPCSVNNLSDRWRNRWMPPNCSKSRNTGAPLSAGKNLYQIPVFLQKYSCFNVSYVLCDLLPAKSGIPVVWLHLNSQAEFSADHHRLVVVVVGFHCGQTLVHTLRRTSRWCIRYASKRGAMHRSVLLSLKLRKILQS